MQARSNIPCDVTPSEVSSPNTGGVSRPNGRHAAVNAGSRPRQDDAWAISPREREVPHMPSLDRKTVTPDTVRGHINNARSPLVAIIGNPELYDHAAIVDMLIGVERQLLAALDVYDGKVPPPPDILAEFHAGHPDAVTRHARETAALLQQPRIRAALARVRAERENNGT